jgi:type I restriction enzyme M protein
VRKVAGVASRGKRSRPENDNLDISWLRDTEVDTEDHLTEPEDIAAAIIGHLKAALDDIETLSEELEPDSVEIAAAEAAE